MFRIRIRSINDYAEIEWEQEITSARSLQGVRSKATRWIHRNLFEADYDEIEKDKILRNCIPANRTWENEVWTLR